MTKKNNNINSVVFYDKTSFNPKGTGYKQTSLMYLRSVSFVDSRDNKRKINLKEISGRKVAKEVKEINKDNWASSIKVLYERGMLQDEEETGLTIIKDAPKNNFIPLTNGFMKDMLRERNSDYINCYFALYTRWKAYQNGDRDLPTFTQGDLIREALSSNSVSGKYHERVRNALTNMQTDGVLVMTIIPVINEETGETISFIRKIVELRECFAAKENVQKLEEVAVGNLKEAESADSINNKNIKIEEPIVTIGVKWVIKEITTEHVVYEQNGEIIEKKFALWGDNPAYYPEGMLDAIQKEGWFILPSGIAKQI